MSKTSACEVERLYLDYLHSDALATRLGKHLTPIGRWNLRHADPLVWTATRPGRDLPAVRPAIKLSPLEYKIYLVRMAKPLIIHAR
jgi:hypothetical protein